MSVIDVFSAARAKVLRLSLCAKFVLPIYLQLHVNHNYIFNDRKAERGGSLGVPKKK